LALVTVLQRLLDDDTGPDGDPCVRELFAESEQLSAAAPALLGLLSNEEVGDGVLLFQHGLLFCCLAAWIVCCIALVSCSQSPFSMDCLLYCSRFLLSKPHVPFIHTQVGELSFRLFYLLLQLHPALSAILYEQPTLGANT
jgi:hypothetical protein